MIPSNDDAIRAVKLVVSIIADAALEGQRIREVDMVDTGQVSGAELAEMEQYLGPSTLAKLQGPEDEVEVAAVVEEVTSEAEAAAEEVVAEAEAIVEAGEATASEAAASETTASEAAAGDAEDANAA